MTDPSHIPPKSTSYQPLPDQSQGKPQRPLQKPGTSPADQISSGRPDVGKTPSPAKPNPQVFVTTFDNIFQEGFESFEKQILMEFDIQSPELENAFKEFAKEIQTLKQFMREASNLIRNQGMQVDQMLKKIMADQRGAFWQKVQAILQKGVPTNKNLLFKQLSQKYGEAKAKALMAERGLGLEGEGTGKEILRMNSGRAMLEMIRAETNPKVFLEHMIVALQLLKKDGFEDSSQKLVNYLQLRWGMSDEEMQKFLRRYPMIYFQGPMPREERKTPKNFWYILTAIAAFPIAMFLGLDFLDSALSVVGAAVVIFILIFILKHREK